MSILPKRSQVFLHKCFDADVVANICRHGQNLGTACFQSALRLFERFRATGSDDQSRTFGGQPFGNGSSYTSARARHQRDYSVKFQIMAVIPGFLGSNNNEVCTTLLHGQCF